MRKILSPSYSITVRLKIKNIPGMLGKVFTKVGMERGSIGAIDIVRASRDFMIRDITIYLESEEHAEKIIKAIKSINGVEIISYSDRTFLFHLGGKIFLQTKAPLKTRDVLSMAYTPGVARIAEAIKKDIKNVWNLTMKSRFVAIVSDGSRVLSLGNIGAFAAIPVMEGKAMIFKELADIDAFPICLDTQDPDEIINIVKNISPAFGAINLEDIESPKCFYIERKLTEMLDIPVFHDDQHATAVVTLAGLINALKITNKKNPNILICGIGAAGTAITKLLKKYGFKNIVGFDETGMITKKRSDLNEYQKEYLSLTETNLQPMSLKDALKGMDVFIGVSTGNILKPEWIKNMKRDPIVFALANPVPEVNPEEAIKYAKIVATGRSDFYNQINNALAYPGVFKGLLAIRAKKITENMKIKAALAIASTVGDELQEDYIVPSIFNKDVVERVKNAIIETGIKDGVATRIPK